MYSFQLYEVVNIVLIYRERLRLRNMPTVTGLQVAQLVCESV